MPGELVLVVEDEPQIADTLERYLRANGFRTERAGDGERALELWRRARPDLILLDLMLPKLDGLEVLKRIRLEDRTPVLILTAKAEEVDRLLGLELGADDYVVKPFSPREVVARVKAILRRTQGLVRPPSHVQVGALEIDLEALRVRCRGQDLTLTPSQVRLLYLLATRAGRALTREELLAGLGTEAEERTVDAHIKNLRARLGPCSLMLETIRGFGYRLREEP
ncbi:response regulator transcription factor [Thermus albus]|uniref:response regulator transcription factor n=1 Tax=Thermus albus TaxID=2908146 RepID=UPI001FAAF162|nr:response regulator transcription factor [Thermus albus]